MFPQGRPGDRRRASDQPLSPKRDTRSSPARLKLVTPKSESPMKKTTPGNPPSAGDAEEPSPALVALLRDAALRWPRFSKVLDGAVEEIECLDAFDSVHEDYSLLALAMDQGFNELNQMIKQTGIEEHQVRYYLQLLIASSHVYEIGQGSSTSGAGGRRKVLYFRTEKPL